MEKKLHQSLTDTVGDDVYTVESIPANLQKKLDAVHALCDALKISIYGIYDVSECGTSLIVQDLEYNENFEMENGV